MQRHLIEYILTLLGNSPEEIKLNQASGEIPPYTLDLATDFKNFLNEIPGGFLIYRADASERIIYANDALLRLMDCSSIEELKALTGGTFNGFVHPDDRDAVENSIAQQIEHSQQALDYVEYRVIRKDGAVRWVEDYGHFIHNDVLGDIFYVFITDATEEIEQKLREKQSLIEKQQEKEQKIESLMREYDIERTRTKQEEIRRQEVIEGLSIDYESIFYVDIDNDLVVPYRLNVRTSQNFDKNRSPRKYTDFCKEFIAMWGHPDDREMLTQNMSIPYIRKKLRRDKTFYFNFLCLTDKDVIHKQARFVNVSSKASQIVIGMRNVDDELRQEMLQKQTLEEALENAKSAAEAKNIFLSNMSHDMRTPLNAISGYVSLAKKNLSDRAAIESYLDKIETAGTQILGLTEKVLDITYAESHSDILKETECNVCDILSCVSKTLQSKAARKKIRFIQDCTGVTSGDVYADAEKLKHLLYQLADNAIKYTKTGGKVELKVSEAEKLPNGFTNFCFKVTDTGIGINKNVLPHIFDAFEREYNYTASGIYGTGLGLTIAKSLTELMGGTIDVQSTVGKGSTFTVNVGFRPQKKSATQQNDAQTILADIKSRKILIVEDNEINLEIETEILEDLGFSTDSAENGRIAIDKLIASPEDYYAVVLMDIQMPVMDGRTATEIIRKMENPVIANIPIIAVSANAFESDRRLSEKAGIDAHLPKPLDVQLLLDTMSDVVSSRRQKQS